MTCYPWLPWYKPNTPFYMTSHSLLYIWSYSATTMLCLFHTTLLQWPVFLLNSRVTRSSWSEGSVSERLPSVEKADAHNSKSCAFWHHVACEMGWCVHIGMQLRRHFRSQLYPVYSYSIRSLPRTSAPLRSWVITRISYSYRDITITYTWLSIIIFMFIPHHGLQDGKV